MPTRRAGGTAWRLLGAVVLCLLLLACDPQPGTPRPSVEPTGADPSARAPSPSGGAPATSAQESPRAGTTTSSVVVPARRDDDTRLRVGLSRNPSSLDPAGISDNDARLVVDALFDSLTRMAPDLRGVEPAAAASWESSNDHRTWTFHLAERQWHDGTTVTAHDFVRGFGWVASAMGGTNAHNTPLVRPIRGSGPDAETGALTGVTALDDNTLRIQLRWPMADLPALVSHPALAPRQSREFNNAQPVGNGPFLMSEPWAHNQFIRIRVVDKPTSAIAVDEIVFLIYAQPGTASLQYEDFTTGVLDVAAVPPDELLNAQARHGTGPGRGQGPGVIDTMVDEVYWMGFNTQRAPFRTEQVRRAVALLVDAEELTDEYGDDSRTTANSLVPPSLPGGGQATCEPCGFDPLRSQALLREHLAAFSDTDTVRILTIEGTTNRGIAQRLADDLEAALPAGGRPDVVVEAVDPATWVQRLGESDLQIFRAGWEATWPTMGGMLEPLFHSRNIGTTNMVRSNYPGLDAAIQDAMATGPLGSSSSMTAWRDVEQHVLDRALVVPIMFYSAPVVVSEDVIGYRVAPTGDVDLTSVAVTR